MDQEIYTKVQDTQLSVGHSLHDTTVASTTCVELGR